jgi:hypothetical protein
MARASARRSQSVGAIAPVPGAPETIENGSRPRGRSRRAAWIASWVRARRWPTQCA